MSTALVTVSEIERMAQAVAASKLFGIQNVEQAMALMLIAQAEGMHPAIAARDYHVIQGRPALKADAMLARFQAAGGKVKWGAYTDHAVSGTFSHPSGGDITIEWDIGRAKAAGLASKENWQKWPRQMLRARCISEGVRTVCPGVTTGLYTPEEIQDMPVERDMGNIEPLKEPDPEGKAKLEGCASMDSLAAAWKALTPAQRYTLEDVKEACKAKIEAADAAVA